MYLEFFHLNEKPFSYLTPNPRFFYYAPQYLNVKRKADYIVSERSGHLYIYGPIGSGKTTVLKTISQMLAEDKTTDVKRPAVPCQSRGDQGQRPVLRSWGWYAAGRNDATLKN